jgi:hypothetical protein
MALEHKSAVGVLPSHLATESTLNLLKDAGLSLDKITLVARTADDDDAAVSENQFIRHQTIERLEKGALDGGVFGAVGGLLIGLASLALPGIGTVGVIGARGVLLLGTAVGSFYGAVGGSLLGAAFGNNMSKEQSEVYSNSLLQGNYLVFVEGTDDEIHGAEEVLKTQGVQDWGIYDVL